MKKLSFFELGKLDKKQKKAFFLNVFLPGAGFFYSLDFGFAFFFGILVIGFIGAGILVVFEHPVITGILWTMGVVLHLGAIYFSTKREVKRESLFAAITYSLLAVGFLIYCFIQFFIQLLKIMGVNV